MSPRSTAVRRAPVTFTIRDALRKPAASAVSTYEPFCSPVEKAPVAFVEATVLAWLEFA